MRARLAGLLVTILLAAGFTFFPTPGRSDGYMFSVAVLRRDGVIVPFATFDGNRWNNRWPAEHATDLPIALPDVPKDWWPDGRAQADWTAWLTTGDSRPIKVQAPVTLNVHCTRRVGLRTDFVAMEPAPPPTFQPYPKSGIAVSGPTPVAVERIQLVSLASPDARALVDQVKDGVAAAETKKVRAWAEVWKHPVDEKGRAKVPVTLEVLARTPGVTAGSMVSYFEGVKKYPGFIQTQLTPLPPSVGGLPQFCEYLTFAGGWVFSGTREPVKPEVGADLSNCNREGLVYTLPLGAIRANGRLFWIVQASSWDFERYDVIEIKPTEIKSALSVPGGACR